MGPANHHDRRTARILACLQTELDPEAIVLYGSAGQGGCWDVAVVSSRLEGLGPLERFSRLAALVGTGEVEVRGFTPAEFLDVSRSIVRELLRTGMPIHDDGTFERARALLAQAA